MTMTPERASAKAPPEVETLAGGRSRRPDRIPRWIARSLSPIALVALWQVLASTGVLSYDVLASPVVVARTAADMVADGSLPDAIVASVLRVLAGVVIGGITAIVLATLSGLFRVGENIIDAPVQMLRTVPVLGLIPLLIVWVGIGEEPKVLLIALAVTFPLYMNLFGGNRNDDSTLVEASRTLGLGWFGQVRHVILPSAMPQFLVGLRYALGTAWLALVFGETINATSGLGYEMNRAREFYETDVIVVCLVVYGLLGLIADLLVRAMEKGLLSWRPAFSGQ